MARLKMWTTQEPDEITEETSPERRRGQWLHSTPYETFTENRASQKRKRVVCVCVCVGGGSRQVSLHSLSCPRIHSANQAGLKLTEICQPQPPKNSALTYLNISQLPNILLIKSVNSAPTHTVESRVAVGKPLVKRSLAEATYLVTRQAMTELMLTAPNPQTEVHKLTVFFLQVIKIPFLVILETWDCNTENLPLWRPHKLKGLRKINRKALKWVFCLFEIIKRWSLHRNLATT